jgi:hypothetical protein
MPPSEQPGMMMLNPPYGERIAAAGSAGRNAAERMGQVERAGRETAQTEDGGEFFSQLASHWKKNYSGWSAWMLTPDLKLPSKMRLKESRRTPMWNGPIECRLFCFDMVKGSTKPADDRRGKGTAMKIAPLRWPACNAGYDGPLPRPMILDTNVVLDMLIFDDPDIPPSASWSPVATCAGLPTKPSASSWVACCTTARLRRASATTARRPKA